MHLAEPEFGEDLFQHFEAVFEVLQVALLALFNQGEDDIHLSPFVDLLTDTIVEGGHTGVEDVCGSHGFAAWRQLIDHTDIEVAIEGHRQRTGDGRCRHHQHVGRIGALAPKFCTLGHPETVLFIYDHEAQTGKLYRVFYHSMGTYQNMNSTIQ